jgi:type II secretory pathway pseudopilin PulG
MPFSRNKSQRPLFRRQERGYVLLTILLMMTLIVIAALAILPTVSFGIRRDREEEMIHRGVQYSRAIRLYYKKFGRYPTRLEELENSNNLRFLRKRYKDPMDGKDFKLLHFGEAKMSLGGPLAGATTALSFAAASNGSQGALNSPAGAAAVMGALNASAQASTPNATGLNGTTDPSQATPGTPGAPGTQSGAAGGNQVFGGGPIVGVTSNSKKETIREFDHKHTYDKWQFIYDPGLDRGGLITTPSQPPLQGVTGIQPGAPPGTVNGNSPNGLNNSPSTFGGTPAPAPPAATPAPQ